MWGQAGVLSLTSHQPVSPQLNRPQIYVVGRDWKCWGFHICRQSWCQDFIYKRELNILISAVSESNTWHWYCAGPNYWDWYCVELIILIGFLLSQQQHLHTSLLFIIEETDFVNIKTPHCCLPPQYYPLSMSNDPLNISWWLFYTLNSLGYYLLLGLSFIG